MALTDNIVTVADAVKARLESNATSLGLKGVWYGETKLIPYTPAVSVNVNYKNRELIQTARTTKVTFELEIYIFHSALDAPGVTKRDCDLKSEEVEAVLHTEPTYGGILIHSFVYNTAPGYYQAGAKMLRTSKIRWQGVSKTRLIS